MAIFFRTGPQRKSLGIHLAFTYKKKEKQLHDFKSLKKILTSLPRRRYLIYLLLSFLAGSLLTGFLLYRPRHGAIGILDKRFANQYSRAAETARKLEAELERERELNRQLREHNQRAREITGGLLQ
jgi:DNA-binding helix-hairpin-helix protein with protein kinase domain